MSFTLSRVDRVFRQYWVGAAKADGEPVDLAGVVFTLVPPFVQVTGETVWTAAEQVAGQFRLVDAAGVVLSSHATFAGAQSAWEAAAPGSAVESLWRILLAGPDADPAEAMVVPAPDGADLWTRVVDAPEVDAEFVERVALG